MDRGHRHTTLNTAPVLRELGMHGGEDLSQIAAGPTTPVTIVQDVSRSFTAERVEPRGLAAANRESTAIGEGPGFILTCLSAGGLVIDDLRLEVVDFGTPAQIRWRWGGIWQWGAWGIGLLNNQPGFRWSENGPLVIDVNDVGGQPTRSSFVTSTGGAVWGSPRSFVAPTFQLQPGVRWYLAPGCDALFFPNVGSDGAGDDPLCTVQMSWREVL